MRKTIHNDSRSTTGCRLSEVRLCLRIPSDSNRPPQPQSPDFAEDSKFGKEDRYGQGSCRVLSGNCFAPSHRFRDSASALARLDADC